MLQRPLKKGDWVVYHKPKRSTNPGRRATNVQPDGKGDGYSYFVGKFWSVAEVLENGDLLIQTRTGKRHEIASDAPCLRLPSLWERIRHRDRFRTPVS